MAELGDRLRTALADRYRIERELGAGGMATVYLAEDLKHQRQVAVKVLLPELAAIIGAERFLAEIKTTANLQHPHILPLFDSGATDSFLFYVMPFVEGESLRDRLNREKQLPVKDAVRIGTEVAGALDYAHRHGVIHRDIKPENILLHEGRALVADFGIALAASKSGPRLTETGLSLGTPQYMSPEQAMGERNLDARSDVYSLGTVLYEMLVGQPPFTGATAQAIVAKVMRDPPAPLIPQRGTVPEPVEDAILTALAKVPADRFDTAAEFAAALGGGPGISRSRGRGSVALASKWKTVGLWSVAGVVLGLAGAALALWLRPAPFVRMTQYRLAFDSAQAPLTERQGDIAFAAITRDGSKLVYLGPGKTGAQLWVQSFGQPQPVPIAGTEGVGPIAALSPDGVWIAFWKRGKIVKMPLNGGAVVPVTADSVEPSSVAWLDDGTIIYQPRFLKSDDLVLRSVNEDGGSSRAVPLHIVGHPAPKGWRIAYSLPTSRGVTLFNCDLSDCRHTMQVWILDLSSHDVRWLADAAAAYYLTGGYMVLVSREGEVDAQRFSLRTLKTGGSRVHLFDGVRGRNMTTAFDVSSNGTVWYQPAVSPSAREELVWVTRDGGLSAIDSTWTFPSSTGRSLALSPDGSRVALTIGNEDTEGIWVKQLPRGSLSRLTLAGVMSMRPRWTPDGRSVTFVAGVGHDANHLRMRRSDATGSDTVLLKHSGGVWEGFLTPDGKWIVARTGRPGLEGADIVGRRVGGDSAVVPLVHQAMYDEQSPALSPNGKWLAYTSNETGQNEVYVRPFPNTDAGKSPISTKGGRYLLWAHSGRELFYLNGAGDAMMVVAVPPEAPFRPGEPRVLFHVGKDLAHIEGNYTWFDVSPDDQRFIMIRNAATAESGATSIVILNWLTEIKARMNAK